MSDPYNPMRNTGMPGGPGVSSWEDTGAGAGQTSRGVKDTISGAKDKVAGAGRATMEKLEQTRYSTADAIGRAADALHRNAERLPGGANDYAHKTASGLESTAMYLRQHDTRAMVSDMEGVIRRNPGPALLGALAIGFLIGRAMSKERTTY